MTGLPKFFKQTSDKPYDRHRYKLVGVNQNELIFNDCEQVQAYWLQAKSQYLYHIEVLDKKKKSNGGFK